MLSKKMMKKVTSRRGIAETELIDEVVQLLGPYKEISCWGLGSFLRRV